MATLVLDHKGLELRPDGQVLALYENGKRLRTVPMKLVDRVIIQGELALSATVITRLVDSGASILFLSKRKSDRIGTVLGKPHNDARIRLAQYAVANDERSSVRFATAFARLKVRGQLNLLKRLLQDEPRVRKPLFDGVRVLERCLGSIEHSDQVGIPGLLGLEGAAAAGYFAAYSAVFPASIGFLGRNRRPPRDPVNASLSLAYTLIHHEAVTHAYMGGLDPYIGFLHAPVHGRESFACDLVEPIRPRVDQWVFEMFKTRTLRKELFHSEGGACFLGKAGRSHFYAAYEKFAHGQRRRLRRLVRATVLAIKNQPLQRSKT